MYITDLSFFFFFFFFNDTATTEIYTLSLHDALPIFERPTIDLTSEEGSRTPGEIAAEIVGSTNTETALTDRKSTRLNSSHSQISYAVFCLKKKKKNLMHEQEAISYLINHYTNRT